MSLDEINELNQHDNIYVACHGFNHIKLEDLDILLKDKVMIFEEDISKATKAFEDFKLSKELFGYPYEYSFPSSDSIVKHFGFKQLFAKDGKSRISIEELACNGRLH